MFASLGPHVLRVILGAEQGRLLEDKPQSPREEDTEVQEGQSHAQATELRRAAQPVCQNRRRGASATSLLPSTVPGM